MNPLALWLRALWPARRQICCVLIPVFFSILPLASGTKELKCLYVVLIMGVFWVSEILPLPVTAFIPLVAYPLLGILSAKSVSMEYLPDSSFIFMGSMIMAIAVERTNLHERMALRVLLSTGTSPRWLMLGFQLATSLISMWINNTATTAMMLPILIRVIIQLEKCHKYQKRIASMNSIKEQDVSQANRMNQNKPVTFYEPTSYADVELSNPSVILQDPKKNVNDLTEAKGKNETEDKKAETLRIDQVKDPRQLRIYKGLLLSVCYSASIGGIGTLVGSAPNFVMVDAMDTLYANNSPLSFTNWMLFAVPLMLFMLFICWLWLQFNFIGFGKSDETAEIAVRQILKKKYLSLGPVGYAEGTVIVCFCAQVFIWISRSPGIVAGWSSWFEPGYATDGTAAMTVALLLFALPSENPLRSVRIHEQTMVSEDNKEDNKENEEKYMEEDNNEEYKDMSKWKTILDWHDVKENFSWGTMFLLGGGFAMAKGVKESGLSDAFSRELRAVDGLPEWLFISVAIVLATALTEFSSNVATASIFIPILTSISKAKQTNPMTYVFPIVISSSFAFMFPAGTPPNAIVFSSGLLKVTDMVFAGTILNLIGLVTNVFIAYSGYINLIFDTVNLPPIWANGTSTATL